LKSSRHKKQPPPQRNAGAAVRFASDVSLFFA